MDLYKKREVRWAYGFDPNGYYVGRVLRQESPLEPGVFLMPAGATSVEPPFKEGFRARWDGNSWNLESIESAAKEASKKEFFADVLESKQNEIIDRIVKAASDIVASSILREARAQIQHDLDLCREQFTGHAQVLLSATEARITKYQNALDELDRALTGRLARFEETSRNGMLQIQTIVDQVQEHRYACADFHAVISGLADRADKAAARAENADGEASRALAEVKEPGFFARLFGKS